MSRIRNITRKFFGGITTILLMMIVLPTAVKAAEIPKYHSIPAYQQKDVYEEERVTFYGITVKEEQNGDIHPLEKSIQFNIFNTTRQELEGTVQSVNGVLPDLKLIKDHNYMIYAVDAEYQNAIKAITDAKEALKKAETPDPTPEKPDPTPEEPDPTPDKPSVENVKVSKITISGISHKIAAGKKIQLKAKVTPSKATDKRMKWTSSNKKYATVTQSGKVTLKKAGIGKIVKITATAKDGSKKKATYSIKIMKGAVKKISISGAKSVKAGKTLKLKATVKASKGANKTLKWSSSNKKYAKVSSSGKVTALKAGKGKSVKITAAATDGSGKKKTVTIKIK